MNVRAPRTALVAVFVVALGAGVVYGGAGVLKVRAMQAEIHQLERELQSLRAQTQTLATTIERLRNDPAYMEKLAREDLGYVRKGETVLKFPATKK